MTETLLLTRADVRELLDLDQCRAAVEEAFRLHAAGESLEPGVLGVRARDGGFHIKAAGLKRDPPRFAAKTNANFSDNPRRHGLPAIQGVVVLCDAADGRVLAVMDSIELTIRRTAAATAVAARHLARPDSAVITVAGCGEQGRAHLRALVRVLPLRRAFAFDSDPDASRACAAELSRELGLDIAVVADHVEAVRASDVCVTCTPSRRAFLRREHVRPGTFVAAVGADSPDKQELDPSLLAAGVVVADVLDQCAVMGELHHALQAGAMSREDVHAELAELVSGGKPGRRSEDEITIFDSTGTALEDVAAAAAVYERAVEAGAGRRVAFGG